MNVIPVKLDSRSYPIIILENGDKIQLADYIVGNQILIVSNTKIAPLYLQYLKKSLSSTDCAIETLVIEDGEQYKNLETINQIWTRLLELNFNRDCTLIALGGGVIGDMLGFVAATYQRGANFIQVPTSLLAMVDASIGGKTGINHRLGKNMIGAFFQPKAIIINPDFLASLDKREFNAGLAEIIKYALLGDSNFFDWLECNIEKVLQKDKSALDHCIYTSCNAKVKLVQADETENGPRALLNLGHTYGHAIETFTGYGKWLHGEAVAVGMVLAALQSKDLGLINAKSVFRIETLLKKCDLPTTPPSNMRSEDFIIAMKRDKKNRSGKQKLILLQNIGEAIIVDNVDPAPMLQKLFN